MDYKEGEIFQKADPLFKEEELLIIPDENFRIFLFTRSVRSRMAVGLDSFAIR